MSAQQAPCEWELKQMTTKWRSACRRAEAAESKLEPLLRVRDAAQRVVDALDADESNLVVVGAAIDLRTTMFRAAALDAATQTDNPTQEETT